MPTKYFCATCNEEFLSEEAGNEPRCPRCMRKGGVQPVKQPEETGGLSRWWLVVGALFVLSLGIAYGAYRFTAVTLEETPPLRPLEPSELSAYLERDQIEASPYQAMLVLSRDTNEWPADAAEIATRLRSESSTWSLEHPLPRELLTAEQTLPTIDSHEERLKLYPLELATAMTALLRQRGVKAMVAEVWEFEGAAAPADPSGALGYFVSAVYGGPDAEEPSAYFDPWGGRGAVKVSAVRVLRDTEVVAAALGTEAIRIFAQSGDATRALPLVEAALQLDPVSPSLRTVNARILVESGGVADAVKELEAALQLRADGPRQLSLAQLHLAQAGMLEMGGEQAAAEAELNEASDLVAEVLEKWPRYGRAHLMRATILLGLDQPEQARVELEIAEEQSPDAPMLWSVWARVHLAQRDLVLAATSMRRAVELDPDNWQLRLQAAQLFQAVGDAAAGSESVAAALRLVPPDRRDEVMRLVERMMGPGALNDTPGGAPGRDSDDRLDLPEPSLTVRPPSAKGAPSDPVLMLGDPSKLRLRDPGQRLELEVDE